MNIRDPLLYPNWLWILGILLLILAAAVVALAFKFAKPHRGAGKIPVHSLGKAQKLRYAALLDEVVQRRQSGELSEREAYLSVAALVRSAASERTHLDLESLTASEAETIFEHWPIFPQALKYCEQRAFAKAQASDSFAPSQSGFHSVSHSVSQSASQSGFQGTAQGTPQSALLSENDETAQSNSPTLIDEKFGEAISLAQGVCVR